MRICFVVGDVHEQKPTYATIHLAVAAHRRGHDVRFVSVDDLSFLDDNNVLGMTTRVRAGAYTKADAYSRALTSDEAVVEEDTLGSFDVVFLRYNPIREGGAHPAAPLIDFGWRLKLGGTLVVNDPEGLRRAGSRMYLADFPADVRTRTLVSRSKKRLREFVRVLDGPAVLKPLAPRGDEPAFYVRRRQISNLNQIITTVTKDGYAIAQEYLPEAEEGEKRLVLLNAEPVRAEPGGPVAIYRRRSTTPGAARGPGPTTRSKCEFGAVEARICDILRPKLLADGLHFVSVDIVGDKLLELNVFTPGGLHSIQELYGLDVAALVVRDLERRVRLRAAYRTTFDPEAADVV
ncbi:MAG TPA: glutathione synthase [Polyangia bacterium]|nr:glutathione synthase [Polyangia bacterium]